MREKVASTSIGYKVAEFGNGDFAAAGLNRYTSQNDNIALVRLQNNGQPILARAFGGSENEEAHAVMEMPDSNILVFGTSNSWGVGGKDILIARQTADGQSCMPMHQMLLIQDWLPNSGSFPALADWQPLDIDTGEWKYATISELPLSIRIVCKSYICGDANHDGSADISDAVWIINYVFLGGPPPDPMAAGDVNCDCSVDLSDAIWIINYVLIGGNDPCDINDDGIED